MRTYLINEEQYRAIRSALYLADYFVQDTKGGSQVEQWESDQQTYKEAMQALEDIQMGVTA